MLHEYAVDPEGLGRLGPMWMLVEQFGVSKGRLIAEFPASWRRLVYDAVRAADCPAVEKLSIIERLNRHKSSMTKLSHSRTFEGANWSDAVKKANAETPFRAIVSERSISEIPNLLSPFDATDAHPLWKVGKPPIPRTAKEIAACAGPLGRVSNELLFVDPYLSSDWDRLSVVREVLNACGVNEKRFRRIDLHVSLKAGDLTQLADRVSEKVLYDLPSGTNLRILKWEKKSVGDAMHARYLLTERGGIRFDYGLAEGNLGETTDVQLLDDSTYEKRWADFQEATAAFDLVGEPVKCLVT